MATRVASCLSSRVRVGCIIGGLAAAVALCLGGWAVLGCKEGSLRKGLLLPTPNEQANNAACLDCHIDLADELIVAKHLENGFSCTACHGESVAHGEDEGNVAKPDVLFGRSEVAPFCKQCHPEHKTGKKYQAFVEEWRGRRRPTGVLLLDDAACTDCHGRHILMSQG